MQIHVLASSSSGNAVLAELSGHRFLIDAGLAASALEYSLQQCGVKPADLSAVLITHEHQDHIKGLDVFTRRHRIPVFTRAATWQKLPFREKLPAGCVREIEEGLSLEGIRIETFPISHDAADPVGYALRGEGKTFVLATDLGIVTSAVESAVREADCLVLESNHDPELLYTGSYPWFLKKRIAGEKGHLSNPDAARLLAENCGGKPRDVFLAHLSQENNRLDLALSCAEQTLTEAGYTVGREIRLHPTFPGRISRL